MTERLLQQVETYIPNIPLNIVSQGAEALVFETSVHPYNIKEVDGKDKFIIKFRPSKPYRHPKVDAAITKNRTVGEVRFMNKLAKVGVRCPSLILTDLPRGIIWMSYLGTDLDNGDVSSFKNWLWLLEKGGDSDKCIDSNVEKICKSVGSVVAQLHINDMIHGDLTSSNIILEENSPALIDFGLSSYSGLAEDKAVDLYVLERAIISTHSVYADKYNAWILQGYEELLKNKKYSKQGGSKKYSETIKKLEDVRLRGRKRSMLG